MEGVIQEKLKEIYNLDIYVKWIDFRNYHILIEIYDQTIAINCMYDTRLSVESNINIIVIKIDKEILNLFKKVVK